ncbi:MAG TPA: hypothetical protein VL346_09900 [Acidobacteriaceae bacterium]|nr:hypothetical protein [Acidobacteriaceae bacterium]
MAAAVTPPLTLGEILDRTIQLYRRNFLLFVGISLAPSACYVLIYGSVSLYLTSHAAQLQGAPNVQLLFAFFGVIAAFLLLGLPLLFSVSALSLSALNYAATTRNSQQPVTIRAAYAYAWKKFWRYLGILSMQILFAMILPGSVFAGILVLAAVSAAFFSAAGGNPVLAVVASLLMVLLVVCLFVGMILIWLRLSLAFPASLVEDLKAWPAIQRSNRLTKGSRGRIFVMYLLVAILIAVAYYALAVPLDIAIGLIFFKSSQWIFLLSKPPLILQVVNLFISFLQRAFALPVYAIALVLFYNDQRTRQEGYDIELLMAQAGWSAQPASEANFGHDAGYAPDPALAFGASLADSVLAPQPEAVSPEVSDWTAIAAPDAMLAESGSSPAEAAPVSPAPTDSSASPPEATEA